MDWVSYLGQLGPPAVFTEQTIARDGTATIRTVQYQTAPFPPQQARPALAPGGHPHLGGLQHHGGLQYHAGLQHYGGQQYPPMQYGYDPPTFSPHASGAHQALWLTPHSFFPQQQLALPYPPQQPVPQYPTPQHALPYQPTHQFVPQHQPPRAITEVGSQSRETHVPTSRPSTDDDVFLKKLRKSIEDQLADPQIKSSGTRQEADLSVMASVLKKCDVARPGNTTAMFFDDGQKVLDELRRDPHGRSLLFFNDERVRDKVRPITLDGVLLAKLDEDERAELDAQDPELPSNTNSTKKYTLAYIRERLDAASDTKFPLNMLSFKPQDCQAVTPWFLQGADFQFLDEIRKEWRTHNKDKAGHLLLDDPTEWATFAECPALTPPHVDADGTGTFLVCVQGRLGIIFYKAQTDDQLNEFFRSPKLPPSGIEYRIKVLLPGEGVFMPAGSIHAVARLPGDEPSLTFGGHVLRADQLPRCTELCRKQMRYPEAINEDPFAKSLPYLIQAGKQLVQAKKKNASTYEVRFGGAASIEAFWETMAKIDENFTERKIKDARTFTYRHRLARAIDNRVKSRKRPSAEPSKGGCPKKQNLSTAQRRKQNSTQSRRVSKRTAALGEALEEEAAF